MHSRRLPSITRAKLKGELPKIAMLLLGAAILSFGLYNVHKQSQITEGGVLGMILFFNHWWGISPAVSGFIMDITCYIIAFRFLGKRFAVYSMIASGGFAMFYSIYERFPPLLPNMSNSPILAAVVGGIMVGLGVGLIVRVGGASGGDDALAMVITHLSGWKITKAYLLTDFIVLALSISYIPIPKILCSLITVTISGVLIGFVQKFGKKKQAEAV